MTLPKVELITRAEWEQARMYSKSPIAKPLLEALAVGNGFKIPCTWNHSTKRRGRNCHGMTIFNHAAKRMGIKVNQRCKDKMLYIWREA